MLSRKVVRFRVDSTWARVERVMRGYLGKDVSWMMVVGE